MAAGLALAVTLPAVPAQAQAIRTFVSAAGSDSNPCSITQPCRHFQAAVNATSVGGEVDALDPGAYGSFTISHAITIEGQGWSYVAPPANGNAITIDAVSGKVILRGVSLNGIGVTNAHGILFSSGGSLTVRDSVIQNFTNDGIHFVPNSSTPSQIFVSNTLVSDNGNDGIAIMPSGSGTTNGVLNHAEMANNANDGLDVQTGTQTITMTVSDSVSAGNASEGIYAASNGGPAVIITVRNSTVVNNGDDGVFAAGTLATIRVTRSTITENAAGGWSSVAGGVVKSYGDNNIDGNGINNSTPGSAIPYH
jgi:hypothetical protein